MKKIQSNWIKLVLSGIILIVVYKLADNLSNTSDWIKSFIGVFAPCIAGGVIAFFLWRPVAKIEGLIGKCKKPWLQKRKKGLAVLVIYLLIIALIALMVNFIIPGLKRNITELAANAPGYLKKAEKFISENELLSRFDFIDEINERATAFVKKNLSIESINKYIEVVSGVASSFMNFFLGVVFSVYILLEGDKIKRFAAKIYAKIASGKVGEVIKKYSYRTVDLFYSYFSALAIDAAVVGSITAVVLGIFKVPYAVLLGFLVAVGNMIPFFGPIIAAVLMYIITAIAFDPIKAIWVIVFQLILGQIDGNVIQPKILGKSIGINPLLVLFAVVVFGELFGFLGMIVGVPVTATLKMIADDYLDNGKIDASN